MEHLAFAAVRRRSLHRQERFAAGASHCQPAGARRRRIAVERQPLASAIKLPELSEDELNSVAKQYQVDGEPAKLVQLVGPEGASPRQAITVVLFDHGDATWFFRMRGDAKLVGDEQPNFEKFVGSVKFREAAKSNVEK